MNTHHQAWQPIRLWTQGQQPHTARHHDCVAAWDVTALQARPDLHIAHPDAARAAADPAGAYPNRQKVKYAFCDRHIDPRFHLHYPHASRATARVQGRTIGDPQREWDVLIEHRDRYLAAAGLNLESPPAAIARCLAESFAGYSHFKDKLPCTTFPNEARALQQAIEGLLHPSFCIGCAMAFAALADASGLKARVLSMGGHVVAEVCVDGHWHLVDSIARHHEESILELYFDSSYVQTTLDPMGDHGRRITGQIRDAFWKRPRPRIHLIGDAWLTCQTLHYTAQSARALYPQQTTWAIVGDDPHRLPLIYRSDGFFYPRVHASVDDAPTALRRAAAVPMRLPQSEPVNCDFLYQPWQNGDKLRESIWLGDLDGCEGVEVVIALGASECSDFSPAAGDQLVVRVNDFEASLNDLGAWPPTGPHASGNMHATLKLPVTALRPHAVNWIELSHRGQSLYYMACVPACMEPYMYPLWSESEDRIQPPAPWGPAAQ